MLLCLFVLVCPTVWLCHRENMISNENQKNQKIKQTKQSKQAITKQNKTKQNKTKQNKTKQNKTKQNKTKQNKTKQNKTKQNKTKQREEGKPYFQKRYNIPPSVNEVCTQNRSSMPSKCCCTVSRC